MPEKRTYFPNARFGPQVIRSAIDEVRAIARAEWTELVRESERLDNGDVLVGHPSMPTAIVPAAEVADPPRLIYINGMETHRSNTRWTVDSVEEFFADIRTPYDNGAIRFGMDGTYGRHFSVSLVMDWGGTTVSVSHDKRALVERVMGIFDDALESSLMADRWVEPEIKPRVFIGHGGKSQAWRDLKDHLKDLHHLDVVTFESGSRAGHTVRDILQEMLGGANFAILVMTGEDVLHDGNMRARQNVVHEAGLFQGRLGFGRAIILLERGVENFSNLDGIQYIPFDPGSIESTYGHVLAAIKAEFTAPSAGN